MIEILDEQILSQQGSWKRVRRWLRGKHPHLGILVFGHTGMETIQEIDVISPIHIFTVLAENESDKNTTECHEQLKLPLPLPVDQLLQTLPQSKSHQKAA